jgi:hypothetical protein
LLLLVLLLVASIKPAPAKDDRKMGRTVNFRAKGAMSAATCRKMEVSVRIIRVADNEQRLKPTLEAFSMAMRLLAMFWNRVRMGGICAGGQMPIEMQRGERGG